MAKETAKEKKPKAKKGKAARRRDTGDFALTGRIQSYVRDRSAQQ